MKQSEICAKAQDSLSIYNPEQVDGIKMGHKDRFICFALNSVASIAESREVRNRIVSLISPYDTFAEWLLHQLRPTMGFNEANRFMWEFDKKLDYSYIQCRRKELLCMIQSQFEREGN